MQIPDDFKFTFQIKGLELNSLEEFYALDKRSVLEHFGFIISKDTLGEEFTSRNITSVEDVQEIIFISNAALYCQLEDKELAIDDKMKDLYKVWIHNTDLLEDLFIAYTKLDPDKMSKRILKQQKDGTIERFLNK